MRTYSWDKNGMNHKKKGFEEMKRKLFIYAPLVFVLGLFAFVKPVQTFALDALSIFRVSDVKTLEITVADLQEGIQNFTALKDKEVEIDKGTPHKPLINVLSKEKPEIKTLATTRDFTAFRLKLPKKLESQKPEISAVDPHAVKFTINTEGSNEVLQTLGSPALLPSSLNNVEMSLNIPAAAFVKYEDVLFFATQKPALTASDTTKEELKNVMLQMPFIPNNIRQQLVNIDLDSSDIYLPVLVGLGREIDLGGRIGYIYTMSDLKSFTETLPNELKSPNPEVKHEMKLSEEKLASMKEMHEKYKQNMPNLENASGLIWTKDGVMYSLVGNKTDAELAKIARSVH